MNFFDRMLSVKVSEWQLFYMIYSTSRNLWPRYKSHPLANRSQVGVSISPKLARTCIWHHPLLRALVQMQAQARACHWRDLNLGGDNNNALLSSIVHDIVYLLSWTWIMSWCGQHWGLLGVHFWWPSPKGLLVGWACCHVGFFNG